VLRRPLVPLLLSATVALLAPTPAVAHRHDDRGVENIVVIYEENHSFDNLYGRWEGVNGLARADAAHTEQVGQDGTRYSCLPQNDVNLTSPPLSVACFDNAPFAIDDFIAPTDTTCPAPGVFTSNGVPKGSGLPGGCTRDLVHRYYQEQYQLDGGKQDRYVTGSDAVGLTMGYYDTTALPVYEYLHSPGHPPYAIADNFFQAAFGGSFLNHQWLVAAATPTWPGAVDDGGGDDLHSIVDENGMPTSYPLYAPSPAGTTVKDGPLTASCPTPAGVTCGPYAVNTIQPPYQPYQPGTGATRRLPAQTAPTIGDRLSAKGVDWAWYSGGWSNANGDIGAPGWTNGATACTDPNAAGNATFPNCPDKLFQYHHQPLNYFASFAPGTAARQAHLRDEQEFIQAAKSSRWRCQLKPVSFVKPIGAENEHPGYASVTTGSDHLVELLSAIETSRCAKRTLVVVTYDEFGGAWDHVPPPGQGTTRGPHDVWGPGTRIPALVLSPDLRKSFGVDHTQYDTTSILATIERRFGLAPLSSRDEAVNAISALSAEDHRGPQREHADEHQRWGQRPG
jgi:acid phosphatase